MIIECCGVQNPLGVWIFLPTLTYGQRKTVANLRQPGGRQSRGWHDGGERYSSAAPATWVRGRHSPGVVGSSDRSFPSTPPAGIASLPPFRVTHTTCHFTSRWFSTPILLPPSKLRIGSFFRSVQGELESA
ncbi:hypothetical protein CDAR_76681 [Caerostris darwini]|uniref:Uncharacterized protein n=1 Tax=Caerostris darwini TaxID=1538125 RepID=A0AAV4QEX9_9ARAC|nr:hypothetical protein CDAR_76681 [Caerostris darwini]